MAVSISPAGVTLEDVWRVVAGAPVEITEPVWDRIRSARRVIEDIVESGRTVYGINTGFGRLADVLIPPERLRELQEHLVISHAAGVGPPLPDEIVRAMMFLRVSTFARGCSGPREETVELLVEMLNRAVTPVVPSKGSVGASGDLAPLAHLALAVIGRGRCRLADGSELPSADALERVGLKPLVLEAKEGLALTNGTQAMTALGAEALRRAEHLCRVIDVVCAISIDALLGTDVAFDPRIHEARGHPGQIAVARVLKDLLTSSPLRDSHRDCLRVQDAYAMRCAPQVHGAVRDSLAHVRSVLEREINAVTDNPLVLDDEVLSGGNFHGAPVAVVLDLLGIAMTDLASISERRIERMVNPDLSGLPAFLAPDPGVNSGFMLPHVTAASLVAESRVLAHPASVDSISTSAGQEDHVSMGTHAGRKALEIVGNAECVVGIELLAAVQALDLRAPVKTAPVLESVRALVRDSVPVWLQDREAAPDMEAVIDLVRGPKIVEMVFAGSDETETEAKP